MTSPPVRRFGTEHPCVPLMANGSPRYGDRYGAKTKPTHNRFLLASSVGFIGAFQFVESAMHYALEA